MRALLSTRLFEARRLEGAHLRLAKEKGFPAVELFADPRHFDPFDLEQVRQTAGLLRAESVQAPWLHVGASSLNQLTDERRLDTFVTAVRGLRLEVVTASTRSWGVRQDGTFLDLGDLQMRLQANGCRLVLDLGRVDERVVRRLPSDLGLCWDMAGATAHVAESEEVREVDEMLEGVSRGRLLGVRVAGLADGRRVAPDRHEARLLEEVWRLQTPGTLVYDVDDPSGFGAEPELRGTLDALRSFHAGDKRDHPEGAGGLFWAGLAPG